ncbi:MAG: hypothetical protein R2771_08155 [Saprospiraceae bacterium]
MKLKHLHLFITILLFAYSNINAQNMYKPSANEISLLPEWAKEMYSENPNMLEVEKMYNEYYKSHDFVKTYHTQYYKRWVRENERYLNDSGEIVKPTSIQMLAKIQNQKEKLSAETKRSNTWKLVGPVQVFENDGLPGNDQTNVYSIDQNESEPDILYCGTEPGEVYKSYDKGQTWINKSLNETFGGGINAIETVQNNPDIVFAGGGLGVFRSTNGGDSWDIVQPISDGQVSEILNHPVYQNKIFACADDGLFVSIDTGLVWDKVFSDKCFDIKCNLSNSDTMYLLKDNPDRSVCEFFRSSDGGESWELISDGWYDSTEEGVRDGGARLAVTASNPDVVYAYLIGEAKTGDLGFIGLMKSSDNGSSWNCQTGEYGGPYTDDHPNLAIGWPGWDYHQGFYNCALMVSNSNEDEILVGGLNLWKSLDGGVTWAPHAGYRGGPLDMHVDVQDMRPLNDQYWVTTDGGIYYSDDFFTVQPEFKMKGVSGSDYWGLGSGWNEDVLVGGLYHNGNLASYEKYDEGQFLQLGGGEAPTGYVNPGNNRKTYFSDIGGKIIPVNITDPISSFSFGKSPNESYWSASSSEMEFYPSCYNIAFIGKDNKIWETNDGGSNFKLLYEFGTNESNQIKYIEISRSNPDVMYCSQYISESYSGKLWKTTDGGISWESLVLPDANTRRILLTLDPLNENNLWVAFPSSGNGKKIYKTTDGGNSWENLSTEALDGGKIS